MNARELRSRSSDELRSELIAVRREAFNLRMQKGMGQLSRPDQMRKLRRDVARLKTILNERGQTYHASVNWAGDKQQDEQDRDRAGRTSRQTSTLQEIHSALDPNTCARRDERMQSRGRCIDCTVPTNVPNEILARSGHCPAGKVVPGRSMRG